MLDRLRPRNWLDGLGLSLQIVSLVGLIELFLHYPSPDTSNWWVWYALNPIVLGVGFFGYVIRRIAKKEPIFGESRKPPS